MVQKFAIIIFLRILKGKCFIFGYIILFSFLFGFSLLGVATAEITTQKIFGSVLRRMPFLPQPTGSRKPSQAFYSVSLHTLKETSYGIALLSQLFN